MEMFYPSLKFYKGNLHTHTTVSDGVKTPQEAIAAYREHGYDFIALTDHRTFSPSRTLEDGFVVLSGTELDHHDMDSRRAFHIVGIGIREAIVMDQHTPPGELCAKIRAAGGIAVAAHPLWSLLTHEDLLHLDGYDHLEVYNTLSEEYCAHGFSDSYADVLMSKGAPKKLLAVDDCHHYQRDFGGGFIRLQTESLSPQNILDSLRNGRYYSSMGPEIRALRVEIGSDGTVEQIEVETSEAVCIAFISDAFYSDGRVVSAPNGTLTKASYQPGVLDRYVRVEVRDAQGKRCWSNFISLQTGRFA